MKNKETKSINYYMRSLHRDIGFFVVGLALIYGISGIVLIYRETGFLKHEKQIERQLSPNIEASELGKTIHMRNFEVLKTEGDVVYFQNGTYNKATGMVKYSDKVLPVLLEKFNNMHKASNRSITHWLSVIFGIALLFLAISSFWMFKPNTKLFRRGLLFAAIGFIASMVLLFL
jgi:hypothetical protein